MYCLQWRLSSARPVFPQDTNTDKMNPLSGRLRWLTAPQEHRALSAESELWIVWLMLELWRGYVMSGIYGRSSMRWWWRLHKPEVPPETHQRILYMHTGTFTICTQAQFYTHTLTHSLTHRLGMISVSVFWAGISWVPRRHGNSSQNKTNHCHGSMLIKTKARSLADGTSHQIVFTHFHKATIIPPIRGDWWL